MAAENLDSKSNPGSDYQLPSGVTSGSADAVNLLAGSEYFVPENMEVFHLGKKIQMFLKRSYCTT